MSIKLYPRFDNKGRIQYDEKLVIDAYDDRALEIPLEVWQVDIICRMLGLSVDTTNLDTYSMRSKEQVDADMEMYYHTLRNIHNKE